MNMHPHGRTTPANRPRKPKGGDSALPATIVEPEALQALRRLRQEAQAEIDRLITFLDATDIDPDLEPSLGWTSTMAFGDGTDLEDECQDEGAQCDDEGEPGDNGIADSGGADEFHSESGALSAFRNDRAIRKTGRPVPAPAWNGSANRQINEAWSQPDQVTRMADGSWLIMHHGELGKLTALPPRVRP